MAYRVKAPSGAKKPKAPKGAIAIGTGNGKWVFQYKTKPAAPKKPANNYTVTSTTQPPDPATGGHYTKVGTNKYQLIHAVGKNKWKPGPAPAPNPLAPMSQQAITAQATKTIKSSYAPQDTDLNQQETAAKALASKRTADNQYYQAWMNSQQQLLESHAQAADQQLQALGSQLQGQQQQAFAGQSQAQVAAANARAGNVSNNAQSTPLTTGIAQSQALNTASLSNAAQNAAAIQGINQSARTASEANAGNVTANLESKNQSDLQASLKSIADARTKEQQSETGDIAKEIARLQGVEIQKAENQQSYNAAAQKLGLQAAVDQANATHQANQDKTAAKNAQTQAQQVANAQKNADRTYNLNLTKVQLSQMNADRTYQLNVKKYNAATAKDLYERQHKLGPYKPASSGSSGNKPLGTASQNVIYNRIAKVQGELRQLVANGAAPKQAFHTLQNGGTVNVPTGKKDSKGNPVYRTVTYSPEDVQILNAAYNVQEGFGLTAGDISALKKMGLANPGSRLTVGPKAKAKGL